MVVTSRSAILPALLCVAPTAAIILRGKTRKVPSQRTLGKGGGGGGGGNNNAPLSAAIQFPMVGDTLDYGDTLSFAYTIEGEIPSKAYIYAKVSCYPQKTWAGTCTGNFNCNYFGSQSQCAHGTSYRDNDYDPNNEELYRYCSQYAGDDIQYDAQGQYASSTDFILEGLRGNDYHWYDAAVFGDGFADADCVAHLEARYTSKGQTVIEPLVQHTFHVVSSWNSANRPPCPCEYQDGGVCEDDPNASATPINYGNTDNPNLSDTCYETI